MPHLWPHPRSLIFLLLVAAYTTFAYGQPAYIDVTCKGAIAEIERHGSVPGIRCDAKGLRDSFATRWTAWNEADPSKLSYTSTQGGFFFPVTEEWMIVELQVDTPLDTVYLPRVKARRFHGKAQLARYTPGDS